MSTIAEKLEYLDGTREKILTETNRLGVGLTEQDKFRDYAKGLHDGYVDILNNSTDTLYDNMEKVSGSGSEITLENTEEAPMKSDLEGDTYQFSTTGKNLFNNAMQPTNEGDSRVAVSTIDTGKRLDYTGSGSSGSYIWRCFAIMDLTNYVGRSIRFKCNFNASGNNKAQYNIGLCNVDGTNRVTKAAGPTSGQTSSFVVPELSGEQTYLLLTLYANANGSIQTNDYVEYTNMILTIDNIDMTYEEYTGGIPSPNPDYPQEIETVTGRQEVNIVGKNLFDKDSAPYIDAYMNTSTMIFASSNTVKTYYIICQPNTTYTIQKVLGKQFRVGTSSEIPVVNGTLLQAWQNNDATQYTITTDSNAKYLCINIRNSSTDTLTEQQILDSLQIEKGSTASEYEEYKGQSYEINLGKNLFDINSNATTLGIEYSFDGSELSLNGATTNAGNIYNNNSNTILLKSGTYTFSTTTSGAFTRNGKDVAIYLRKKSDSSSVVELFSTQGYIIQQTFTINEDTELYMQLYTNGSGFVFDDFKIYLMLEKGSQSTSYSPYKTPIELCKIGDYKDRIYKDNNKWYIEKQIGKVVLNGSENWNNDGGTQGTDYRHNIYYASRMAIPSALGTSNTYLSNYFTQRNVGSDSGYLGSFYMSNGWLVFVDKNKVYDLDQWKTWLSTHNTTVYYVLATPTTTEITDSELISQLEEWYNQKSNKDVTYISVTSEDLPAILNVVAIKNYE